MRNRQINKLAMFHIVEKVLSDHSSIVNSSPAFMVASNAFSGKINDITNAMRKQLSPHTGVAEDKKQLKNKLTDNAVMTKGIVSAYATVIGNNELREAVKFSRTKLFRMRDNRFLTTCKNIYDNANAYAGSLDIYGLTSAKLNSLLSDITAYSEKMVAPRNAIVSKQTATIALAEGFREADKILKLQLDNIMVRFKFSGPAFYNTYKAARQIVDRGSTHTSLRILVKDSKGNLIPGAVAALLSNNKVVYTKPSSGKGIISIARISPAIYDLVIIHPGFKTHSKPSITCIAGKRVARTIQLLPMD